MKAVSQVGKLGRVLLVAVLFAGCSLKHNPTPSPSPNPNPSPNPSPNPNPNPAPGGASFTIGGTVIGLQGSGLVLEDNGTDDLTITGTGTVNFTFKTAVSSFKVTVKTQPNNPTQTCSVTANGSGTATANVTNVQIACGVTFTIGGQISGILGSGMVLQDNGGDNLTVSGTGNVNFTFATQLLSGSAYAVTIKTQPSNPSQNCGVTNGSGTATSNVTTVQIVCVEPKFAISGSVVGLVTGAGDTQELHDDAGDDLFVTGDVGFTFPTRVTNGDIFRVTQFLPPNSQPQPCNIFNGFGIATADVTNVIVDCQHNDWNWISWFAGPSIESTNKAGNYATVTSPRFPTGKLPPADISTPGGRDFAMTWTDHAGRKWLFGGFGLPFPSTFGNQPAGLLSDFWVFDPGASAWIPANLGTFLNADVPASFEDDTTTLEDTEVSGSYPNTAAPSPSLLSVGTPGSRWGGSSWTDVSGTHLFMFGGQGHGATGLDRALLNDLWEFTPDDAGALANPAHQAGTFPGTWNWLGGSTTGNQLGTYGTQGTALPTCTPTTVPPLCHIPGGRFGPATAVDSTGQNVYLFGGQGVDSLGHIGLLNDLWKYNIAGGTWTWLGPTNSNVSNQQGLYGTQGSTQPGNFPGGREEAILWVDSTNTVWLFGGFGFDSMSTGAPDGGILNDLWKFDGTNWTWVSGSHLANQSGVYGTQTVSTPPTFPAPSAGSVPGARWGAVAWMNPDGDLFLFGGFGFGSSLAQPTGFLNDIWEYDRTTGQWLWWKGTSGANQNGAYLTHALPFVNNVVGGRRGTAIWAPADPNGYIWMFGGQGDDSLMGSPPGFLNDLWTYLAFP